ncbi:hypothetical protein PTKIN_Ptkin08bG0193900 [Pterospermum kingtungense]
MELSVNNIETEKLWHYQDPQGRTQGPFPMAMLRRWSASCHFPPDLKIWRVSEKQDDSILLTDALDGRHSQVQQFHKSCVPTEDIRIASDDGCQNRGGDVRESRDLDVNQMESKKVDGNSKSTQNYISSRCGNNESVSSKELGSQSSSCTASVDIVTTDAVLMGSPLSHWDSAKGDNYFPAQLRVSSSLPSSTLSGKPCETESHEVSERHERWDCDSIDMNESLNKTSEGHIVAGNAKQDDSEGKSAKSCGQSWRSRPLNDASNGRDLSSGLISLARALEASEHNQIQEIDFPDLPTSTSKLNHEDSNGQDTENKQSFSSNPNPRPDSGPSWSSASSLAGSQLAEVAGEWGGYSSNPAKLSSEEWNSDLVPESSFRPTDLGSDHVATPTSGSGQLTHSSPTDPANNGSGWDSIGPDESVSDLLAEVEAMESLKGLASPALMLCCDGDLAQGSEPDCFSPVEGLSPAPDPGKSDALSSTNDVYQTRPMGLPIEGGDPSTEEQTSSSSSSNISQDYDLWIHENSGLLRPVFRCLDIESEEWLGLEETAVSPAKHCCFLSLMSLFLLACQKCDQCFDDSCCSCYKHFLRLLAEEIGEVSSEILDQEVSPSKAVDTMALGMETNSESSKARKEKYWEYEHESREKYSAAEVPSNPVVANQQMVIPQLRKNADCHMMGDSLDEKPAEEVGMLSYRRKVMVLYELLSACLAAGDTCEDNKRYKCRRKGYDAQHRDASRLLTTWFDVEWIKMVCKLNWLADFHQSFKHRACNI